MYTNINLWINYVLDGIDRSKIYKLLNEQHMKHALANLDPSLHKEGEERLLTVVNYYS